MKTDRSSSTARTIPCAAAIPPLQSWHKRWFPRARIVSRPAPGDHAGLNVSLALQMELNTPVWMSARGTSMLPWPLPGHKVKIEPLKPTLGIGDILVFRRGARLFYHRVVECLAPNLWRTKGDTLIESDNPISPAEVIGQVTAARRGNRVRPVHPDRAAAWLSERLGQCFGGPARQPQTWRRRFLRLAYLGILLSTWPWRRQLARYFFRPDGDPITPTETQQRN